MEPEIQCKIEQTVLEILKNADMDEMTEFKVRSTASERLGIDLTDIQCKKFIRGIVESFLLSSSSEECKVADANFQEANRLMVKEFGSDGIRVICTLSNKRNVVIKDFKGKSYVSIREFNNSDGRQVPTNKGINLPAEQWSIFRKSVPLIEEAVMRMQSKLRSSFHCEQKEQKSSLVIASTPSKSNGQNSDLGTASSHEVNGQASTSANASMPLELNGQAPESANASIPLELNGHVAEPVTTSTSHQPNSQICDSAMASTSHELNGQMRDPAISSTLHELVPIEVNRFDGNNYNYWAPLMELFLKRLKIAYVLTDPCPSVTRTPEASAQEIAKAKDAQKKWLNDDYMCHHNILASLSDALYKRYSKNTKSGKELWEELKLVYLCEEFGKKRSQVKSYIEFQMVDEKPISEQVQELNNIADSIVAAGISVDEKFHVSAIISKLPPSWKDLCIKLMCEEHLPFWMLMDRIKIEEESRYQNRQAGPSNSACFDHAKSLGPRMHHMKKQGFTWKRRETHTDNKALTCYFCGKKGHISKNCL